MEWLKKNASLALGVGLPLLLVIFFALAAGLPKIFVGPPHYDVLYLANFYDNFINYRVENKHIVFEYNGQRYNNYYNRPRLFRYSPTTGSVKEISLSLPSVSAAPTQPPAAQNMQITPLPVPELKDVNVDTSSIAPDGYEFHFGNNSSPGVSELFFARGHNEPMLSKNGNVIRLPNVDNTNFYFYNVKFIGWVVP